ncbi:MAG: single-stranded DNA-binding protein [Clostridia bacterium]|nr:single-stranded DNA-binding protein [Clostridia bacterium]
MANFNLNKVILGGRVTADPELKHTPQGIPVCSFSVAVNRRSKDGQAPADFINCQAWRATAEFISRYFKKGSSICLVGSIQTRTWNDQQGNKRYATEVIADEAFFVDSKSESDSAPAFAQEQASFQTQQTPKFEEIAGDDDLPF